MKKIFGRTPGLTSDRFHYCPGCTHGIINRLVAEVTDELGIIENTVGVAPVGCAMLILDYFACDMQSAPHGRAPAVATGIKRSLPPRRSGGVSHRHADADFRAQGLRVRGFGVG